MIMVSVALVMSVIVTNIHLRKDSPEAIPKWLRSFLRRQQQRQQNGCGVSVAATSASVGLATRRRSVAGTDGMDNAIGLGLALKSSVPSETENASFSDTEHRIWQKCRSHAAVGAYDGNTSGRNHVMQCCETNGGLGTGATSGNNTTYSGHSPRMYRASVGVGVEGGDKCHVKMQATSEEWHTLACLVDRVFFWLFLVTSVVTLSAMYLAIPSYL